MNLKNENNYISPESSKILLNLGIRWKSAAYWQFIPGQKKYVLKEKIEPFKSGVPAYSVIELGHLIPFGFFNQMKIHKYLNGIYKVLLSDGQWHTFMGEAECRAFYLIDLIKTGKATILDIPNPHDKKENSGIN